ncbi:MAG: hypothetical protein LH609_20240 [Rudanella sp.]|nr:hypothetical protein [Rudanella sp.]
MTSLFTTQHTVAQVICQKPDAGPDVTSNAASVKLKEAPNGFFWSIRSGNARGGASVHAQTGLVSGLSAPGPYTFVLSSIAPTLKLHSAQPLAQDGALQSTTIDGLAVLDNGQIKLGVDSRYGGAITHLSTKNGSNMVNNHDRGRQVQIGIYGGPVPFLPPNVEANPPWRMIGWNPIQAGDSYNNVSKILAFEKRNNLLYVKTLPKFWHLNNYEGEAIIEHWIRLSGNVVKVHARVTFSRADKTQYDARDQEFPCLYLNGNYKRSWNYSGTEPYTNADKQVKIAPFSMINVRATEPWVALTRDDDFGVGLYSPQNLFFKEAFFGNEFSDSESAASSAYIAATPFAQLDHNSVTDFDYELIVGHINDIRSYVYTQPRPDKGPNFRFTNSRLNWHLVETTDAGSLITNHLHLTLNGTGSQQLKSPAVSWRGRENPKVYVRAAFNLQGSDSYRFHWQNLEDSDFLGSGERIKDFKIQNDGQFHTYEIDLRNTSWMNSSIRQVMFRPAWDGPAMSGSVKVEWFSTSPDGPPLPQPESPSVVCTDTVTVNFSPTVVVPLPNAGPDIVLRCGVSSTTLTPAATGFTWQILSKPTGSAAIVMPNGFVNNLQMPGNYLLTLSNDASKAMDIMGITVPACLTPQSLSSVVFLDNGSGGGIARNGRQEPGERGFAGVRITVYTDPNGDGSPAEGRPVEQTTTNSRGEYVFTKLYTDEFYVIGLDAGNFGPGQPLWRVISTRQASFTLAYGLLSGRIVVPGVAPVQTRTKAPETDPSFALIQDCSTQAPNCLTVRIRRL